MSALIIALTVMFMCAFCTIGDLICREDEKNDRQ